jgi:hypothetical protein
MKCSICKTELIKGERTKFDTKQVHVTYVCNNCNCNSFGMCWDKRGALLSDSPVDKSKFIDKIVTAFGSELRNLKISELNPPTNHTRFSFHPFKFVCIVEYKFNEFGKIIDTIKTKKTLKWCKKINQYVPWINPWILFRACVNDFKTLEDDELKRDSLRPPKWDKRWGRRLAGLYLRTLNRKIYQNLFDT